MTKYIISLVTICASIQLPTKSKIDENSKRKVTNQMAKSKAQTHQSNG